ncbi:hypothetical protein [Morganella phage Mecenats66]|nr:hypothetical protein [Morganella phage Mecenats66]
MKVIKISELYAKASGLFSKNGPDKDRYMTAERRDLIRAQNLNKARGELSNMCLTTRYNLDRAVSAAGTKLALRRYLVSDPDTQYLGAPFDMISNIPCALGKKAISGDDQTEPLVYSEADLESGNFYAEWPFEYDRYGNRRYEQRAVNGAGYVINFSKAGRVKVYGIYDKDGVLSPGNKVCLFDRIVEADINYMLYAPFTRYTLVATGTGNSGENGRMRITGAYV